MNALFDMAFPKEEVETKEDEIPTAIEQVSRRESVSKCDTPFISTLTKSMSSTAKKAQLLNFKEPHLEIK